MKLKAILALMLAICAAPAIATADYVDDFGDAQDSFGVGGPLLDIDSLSIQFDSTTLYFDMLFHTPISPTSAIADNSVIGAIEFDTDQSDETGVPPLQNGFSPPFATLGGVGVDFLLILDDSASPGSYILADSFQNFLEFVPVSFTSNGFSGQIPLSSLGNDDGLINFTTTIGTIPQPTDATDSVATSTAIPEPTGTALILFAGVLGSVRRRR